jgi:GNAT superfamily N-acetyltransferase
MNCSITIAGRDHAQEIAALHTASWRAAYRGILPDWFLDGPLDEDRLSLWRRRLETPPARQIVLRAASAQGLKGFACLYLEEDPTWGALLDNLHVQPASRGKGVGRQLFEACKAAVATDLEAGRLYLWVFEANVAARRFYDRQGGCLVGRRSLEIVPGVVVAELRYAWGQEP